VDVLSSFIFGKPKSLPAVRQNSSQTHLPFACEHDNEPAEFSAIVKSCSLLEDIVDKLSCGKILHVPTAESLLQQLRGWSRSLPTSLRKITVSSHADSNHLTSSGSDQRDRRQTSGALHVSCIYYFSVILITRPFLIAYLLSRLKGRAPDQLIPDPDEASDVAIKNSTVSKMAQVCVSAAVHTANTCAAAQQHGYSFGNLCLLKAWVFGAGLVLGFSKFAGEPRKDIEEAFEQINIVLESIAVHSPQASLYRETLESLRESVAKWHGRIRSEINRTVKHYMDDILIIDREEHELSASLQGLPNATAYERASASDGQTLSLDPAVMGNLEPWLEPWPGSTPRSSTEVLRHLGFGDISGDFGSYDDTLFNFEPFEKLFYSVE
jgi:hypothetical protein